MAAKGNAVFENGKVTASVGNPNLKPFKDNSIDLAVEYYFGKVGTVSASVFHKAITNFIDGRTYENKYTLDQVGLTGSIPGAPGNTVIDQYSKPINIPGTNSLTGIELAAQSQFSFLPAPFDNLGMSANFTHVDAPQVFTGISKTSYNATLYYETADYGGRVSMSHRSLWYTGHDSDPASDGTSGFEGGNYVDAAAFWNVRPGLQVTFDAINLTDQKDTQFWGQPRYLHNQTQSGATYMIGFGYKF